MEYISEIEFETGVPVLNIIPFPPVFSSRYLKQNRFNFLIFLPGCYQIKNINNAIAAHIFNAEKIPAENEVLQIV